MAGGRDTIKQRIALDGGEAIRQELAELGKVGEAAFRKLQKAAADMKGPDNSFVGKLQQIKKELETTGKAVTKFGEQVKGIGKSMTSALSLPIAGHGRRRAQGRGRLRGRHDPRRGCDAGERRRAAEAGGPGAQAR